jgi:hypothetical protein
VRECLAISFRFQNPESARSSFGPVAPALAIRGMSSSTNRSAQREVFAEPVRPAVAAYDSFSRAQEVV